MKSAGKARNNGLYRHIRTSKEIIRNLLNDCGNNIKQQAERKGSACCFSTSINARLHKKSRNIGVLKEIGKPLGAFYPSKSFNQPIASVSLCTSARSFFFSMSIASRYTRISFAKSPPISARR